MTGGGAGECQYEWDEWEAVQTPTGLLESSRVLDSSQDSRGEHDGRGPVNQAPDHDELVNGCEGGGTVEADAEVAGVGSILN